MLGSNPDVITNLRSKWGGPSFWSPAVGKQGGVALFEKIRVLKLNSGKKISLAELLVH